MSGISFRLKLLALVMAPILSMFVVIATVVVIQSDQLSSSQEEVIRNETMASKKQELLQYMDLALRAINPIYEAAEPDDESAKQEIIALLNNFTFGRMVISSFIPMTVSVWFCLIKMNAKVSIVGK
ncbi:hypothetical protein [Veronia nyctiphanis]|uniref:hypothetical protein n=1 Tax=Veronia nyctiphanis TaxID=1278244 RepID=UPI001F238F22|nr:hypothetical protein [Veronia nyctiphanis]